MLETQCLGHQWWAWSKYRPPHPLCLCIALPCLCVCLTYSHKHSHSHYIACLACNVMPMPMPMPLCLPDGMARRKRGRQAPLIQCLASLNQFTMHHHAWIIVPMNAIHRHNGLPWRNGIWPRHSFSNHLGLGSWGGGRTSQINTKKSESCYPGCSARPLWSFGPSVLVPEK